MAKTKNEGIFKKTGRMLKKHSVAAQKATILLVVMILLCIIAGIVGSYLYTPAKELYISEDTFHKESREIYSFKAESEERAAQVAKADEAEKVFGEVMDKYMNDTNTLIRWYAGIDSSFFKAIIALLIAIPYIAIIIMFIGGPVNFLFAVINIVIVTPVKAIVYLFNSCRNTENKKRIKKLPSLKMKEA